MNEARAVEAIDAPMREYLAEHARQHGLPQSPAAGGDPAADGVVRQKLADTEIE